MLTVNPKVKTLASGYCSPFELPISGSHSLNLANVNKLVPMKNMRILLNLILFTIDLGIANS